MADTVKSSSEIKMEMYFADGDTRTLSEPNPKANVGATEVKALESVMVNTQPVLGDKTGAAFVRFNSAEVVKKTKTSLDIS